ncbi:hypothetical protein CDO24_13955 [Sinorhizobium meliloti]|nr:hypothetical protein CDO24_13955 [Sinorhizobium meliloti]
MSVNDIVEKRVGFAAQGRPLGLEEVALIRAILKDYCAARCCHRDGEIAQEAARHLVRLYQRGYSTRDELVCRLTKLME